MASIFRAADILLPKYNMEKWAVIACDQFTSQPEYWEAADRECGSYASALRCILPEVYLAEEHTEVIDQIHKTMREYLDSNIFETYRNSYIYIERILADGSIRRGVAGCVDLEAYDFHDETDAPVRATEKTVMERIPPRMALRENAPLDMSHVILFCDDEKRELIEKINKNNLQLIYDIKLMLDGGFVKGWLLAGSELERFEAALQAYEKRKKGLVYAVGDGNHSLASAKTVYEQGGKKDHPSRFALVELENIYDPIQEFEPIHRIIRDIDPDHLIDQMKKAGWKKGRGVRWITDHEEGELVLSEGLALEDLQEFLDKYILQYGGELDYIHGQGSLRELIQKGTGREAGFLLEPLSNDGFFRHIEASGVYPRKTFSIGHANDKRYYLETRDIR